MKKFRIAVPTEEHDGLEDKISEVLGKAKTFTILDVEGDEVRNVRVVDNPASSYEYGSGPITVKMLKDLNVNFVLASEFGPGVSTLLEEHEIKMVSAKPGTKVSDAVKEALPKLQTE